MRKFHNGSDRQTHGHGYRSHAQPDLLALIAVSALTLLCAACSAHGAPAAGAAGAKPDSIKLASWNLEWLIAPAQFKALRDGCTQDSDTRSRSIRSIPCDVAYRLERSATDFAVLASYAAQLDADVVALQEVDGESAARLVFRNHDFCFTARRHPQNNGFAVRRGVPHRCEPDFVDFSASDSLRRGAVMTLDPDGAHPITLMSVHLKSGCSVAPLESRGRACQELVRQLPALGRWIRSESAAGRSFAVLGDFNRDLGAERRSRPPVDSARGGMTAALGLELQPEQRLTDAADGARFQNCFPGQMHTGFIDYILLDPSLAEREISQSFQHLTYRLPDAHGRKLSDHCPVAVRLKN